MSLDKPWLRPPKIFGVPIAIYQMGKVGSRTIQNYLDQFEISNSIHHLHLLSHERIGRYTDETEQIVHSRALRKYLDESSPAPITVITAVREPVAQFVSCVFQNLENNSPHLIHESGQWDDKEIAAHIQNALRKNNRTNRWCSDWFDGDFKPALGIDVFERPFDHDRGFVAFAERNTRVLVLRLEDSKVWPKAISDFLGLEQIATLMNTNVASDKHYKEAYQRVLDNLDLTESDLQAIYGTKYARHFYTTEMIKSFIGKWCRNKVLA